MEGSKKRFQRLLRLALRQGGWFTTRQAGRLGYDTQHIAYHVASKGFRRCGRGLYRLAALPEQPDAALHHALLWSADSHGRVLGVIGHESALDLHGAGKAPKVVCLRLPDGYRRRPPRGVRAHYGKPLAKSEVVLVRGLRCQSLRSVVRELLGGSLRDRSVAARVLQATRSDKTTGIRRRK
jgi:hypothetical protein